MKKIIIVLLTLAFFACQNKLECNPKEFKTSKFEFVQEVNGKKEIRTKLINVII